MRSYHRFDSADLSMVRSWLQQQIRLRLLPLIYRTFDKWKTLLITAGLFWDCTYMYMKACIRHVFWQERESDPRGDFSFFFCYCIFDEIGR